MERNYWFSFNCSNILSLFCMLCVILMLWKSPTFVSACVYVWVENTCAARLPTAHHKLRANHMFELRLLYIWFIQGAYPKFQNRAFWLAIFCCQYFDWLGKNRLKFKNIQKSSRPCFRNKFCFKHWCTTFENDIIF